MHTLVSTMTYRNERVVARFLSTFAVPQEAATMLFDDTVALLWLIATARSTPGAPWPIQIYTPMTMMDEMWHLFILFTKDYHAFCDTYLDGYIHHTPLDDGFDPQPSAAMATQLSFMYDHIGQERMDRWFNRYAAQFPPPSILGLRRK